MGGGGGTQVLISEFLEFLGGGRSGDNSGATYGVTSGWGGPKITRVLISEFLEFLGGGGTFQ